MKFPSWTEQGSDTEVARKRLRYMVQQAAICTTTKGTMSAFATLCGVDRTSMHNHIASGAFPASMATAIEAAVGRSVLCHEWLMRPLGVAPRQHMAP